MLANKRFLKMMKASNEWTARFDKASIMRSYVLALDVADVVVARPLCLTRAMCVAEKMGCGYACLVPGPTLPTSEFSVWVLPVLCPCLNRWTYKFMFDVLWRQEKRGIDDFQKRELSTCRP
jgi:hypothetical protein